MSQIKKEVSELLQKSPDDSVSRDEADSAFQAERISRVVMRGSGPVVWTIFFDTDIGEGEALQGRVSGKDQRLEDATLFM